MTFTYTPEGYKEPQPQTADKYIFVDGPHSNATARSDWDEFPEWYVGVADNDGEPIGKTYTCHSLDAAVGLGRKMANDRNLELVNEAGCS